MSHTYKPAPVGEPSCDLEFQRIQRALNDPQPIFSLQVLHVQPVKRKAGDVVYADGVDWNPGSGEGLYRYTLGGSWAFIG